MSNFWLMRYWLQAKAISGLVMILAAGSSSGWIRGAKSEGGLQSNYYAESCPNAEAIALQTLQSSLFIDITAPAALLRLTFHDCQVQEVLSIYDSVELARKLGEYCWSSMLSPTTHKCPRGLRALQGSGSLTVHGPEGPEDPLGKKGFWNFNVVCPESLGESPDFLGCDASVLLQSTSTFQSEMVAERSFGVRRLDFIDRIKTALETACPATVSCADIIVMAGRDSVAMSGGPNIPVTTGRRDGMSASNTRADDDLPSPLTNVDGLLKVFQPKGLSMEESVALIGGGHSLGIGHCVSFINRLYPQMDPTVSTLMGNTLQVLCPNPTSYKISNITFFNNDLTNVIFDNQYFRDLQGGRGLFTIDSEISKDPRTQGIVKSLAANQNYFFQTFTSAFLKLTSWQVLTGTDGEIRKDCRFVN